MKVHGQDPDSNISRAGYLTSDPGQFCQVAALLRTARSRVKKVPRSRAKKVPRLLDKKVPRLRVRKVPRLPVRKVPRLPVRKVPRLPVRKDRSWVGEVRARSSTACVFSKISRVDGTSQGSRRNLTKRTPQTTNLSKQSEH